MKAFMIAGVSSGIGKTTISMGLMSFFENVSPYKVGPDYIDPTFHEAITKNKSYNLDLFMMGEDGVKYSFYKHHKNISIVEGVMGLYDGLNNELDNGSSAHLARILDIPIILVVDGIGKSTSIAAQILGYKNFDPRVRIEGVIINKVSSSKTYEIFKNAIEKYTGIECLGYIPKDEILNISSRHLGLLQAQEIKDLENKLLTLREIIKKNINTERIKEIANLNRNKNEEILKYTSKIEKLKDMYKGKVIAIAKDSAFSFYYNDNIELFNYLGCEIKYFSPINDKKIPKCDLIYFGGGYPENFLNELSNNYEMINSIREKFENNIKMYAECGGFMYLSKSIETLDKKEYKMCDIVPVSITMTPKLDISRFGYINVLDENSEIIARGHEFHYSKIKEILDDKRIFTAEKENGKSWKCIFKVKNLYAGYPHINFLNNIILLKKIMN